MPFQRQSGSDLIPVNFPTTITATLYYWADPDENPRYFSVPRATPTFDRLVVYGPSSEYLNQIATYGNVGIRVTTSPIQSGGIPAYNSGAPVFVDVFYNGVQYKFQAGVTVTVPRIVYDLVASAYGYAAVLT